MPRSALWIDELRIASNDSMRGVAPCLCCTLLHACGRGRGSHGLTHLCWTATPAPDQECSSQSLHELSWNAKDAALRHGCRTSLPRLRAILLPDAAQPGRGRKFVAVWVADRAVCGTWTRMTEAGATHM